MAAARKLSLYALRAQRKQSRWPEPREPKAIAAAFYRDLRALLDRMDAIFLREITGDTELAQQTEEIRGEFARVDAVEPEDTGNKAIDLLARKLYEAHLQVEQEQPDEVLVDLLQRHGRAVNEWNLRETRRQFKAALGVDILGTLPHGDAIFRHYVEDNVSRIKTIREEHFKRIEETVRRHWRVGDRWEEIADKLHRDLGVNKNRAALIARDQVGKLNGELARDRMEALGVRRFIWRTSLDGRVRKKHRELEGRTYSYPHGHPTEKIPGWPIRCRCYPEPVFEDEDGNPEGPLGGPLEQDPFPESIGYARTSGGRRSRSSNVGTPPRPPKSRRPKRRPKPKPKPPKPRVVDPVVDPDAEARRREAEAKRRREAEEARKAAEEAKRKAEEERRRKAEEKRKAEEAKRKAEEQRRKEAEEAKRKAAEAKRKAEEARKAAEAAAFAKAHKIRPDVELDVSTMKKVGGQAGSNEGGLYEDASGQRWYIKTPTNPDQARSEVLAAKLYELAGGVPVAEVHTTTLNGKLAVASKIETVSQAKPEKLAKTPTATAGFATDAWLANWDVVGLAYDNLQLRKDGKALRLDVGGALEFRAQGAKKGSAFGTKVTEISSLRDPKVNRQSAAVFGEMTDAQLLDSMKRVTKLTDKAIRAVVDRYGYGSEADRKALAAKLIARKKDLVQQAAKIELEASTAAAKSAKRRRVPDPPSWKKAKTLEDRMLKEATPALRQRLQAVIDEEKKLGPLIPRGQETTSFNANDTAHRFGGRLPDPIKRAFLWWSNGGYVHGRAADGGVQAGRGLKPLDAKASNFVNGLGRAIGPEDYVDAREHLLNIRRALQREDAPRHEGTVYRGLVIPDDAAKEHKDYRKMLSTVGAEFKVESIASWTHNESVATEKFSRDEKGAMVIRVKKSTRGVPMGSSRLSHYEGREYEVLIDKGHRYRVVSVSKRPSDRHRIVVDLEEIEDDED